MNRGIVTILLFLLIPRAEGQPAPYRYQLEAGDRYFLSVELTQETETDNRELIEQVSLDISSRVEMTVTALTGEGHYQMSCRYTDLELSFFSPGSDLYISSENQPFSPLKTYLDALEKQPFTVVMTTRGEIVALDALDSAIHRLQATAYTDPDDHELITTTIRNAFGEAAFTGMADMALNVLSDTVAAKLTREATVAMGGKLFRIVNNFYYQPAGDTTFRVQGVGVLRETSNMIRHKAVTYETTLDGQQTYDFLRSRETGWMIRGISRQRFRAEYKLTGHKQLPEGLKIPAYTVSEYQFEGGRTGRKEDP